MTTKKLLPLYLETFTPIALNAMERDEITENIEAPPRVSANSINSDTDTPPRKNSETLTAENGGPSKIHAFKDHVPPPRVRSPPMPIQIKPV